LPDLDKSVVYEKVTKTGCKRAVNVRLLLFFHILYSELTRHFPRIVHIILQLLTLHIILRHKKKQINKPLKQSGFYWTTLYVRRLREVDDSRVSIGAVANNVHVVTLALD